MSEKDESTTALTLEEQLQQSLDATRCPHCGTFNPVIRVVRAYRSPCGMVVIFSCQACKRIINCGLTP